MVKSRKYCLFKILTYFSYVCISIAYFACDSALVMASIFSFSLINGVEEEEGEDEVDEEEEDSEEEKEDIKQTTDKAESSKEPPKATQEKAQTDKREEKVSAPKEENKGEQSKNKVQTQENEKDIISAQSVQKVETSNVEKKVTENVVTSAGQTESKSLVQTGKPAGPPENKKVESAQVKQEAVEKLVQENILGSQREKLNDKDTDEKSGGKSSAVREVPACFSMSLNISLTGNNAMLN